MTRRFDRINGSDKLHMQSLGALAHFDFNAAGAHSYEQALQVIRQLNLGMTVVEQQFRRMAFNVIARNQDDHVKNIAFLMDRSGEWSLSPAFDITYAYAPSGAWTNQHQMSINGKRDDFTTEDFATCARTASMKRGAAQRILDDVRAAVSRWKDFASDAGVDDSHAAAISRAHRLSLPRT
jgi:serine/threonine-protein kinase HipA